MANEERPLHFSFPTTQPCPSTRATPTPTRAWTRRRWQRQLGRHGHRRGAWLHPLLLPPPHPPPALCAALPSRGTACPGDEPTSTRAAMARPRPGLRWRWPQRRPRHAAPRPTPAPQSARCWTRCTRRPRPPHPPRPPASVGWRRRRWRGRLQGRSRRPRLSGGAPPPPPPPWWMARPHWRRGWRPGERQRWRQWGWMVGAAPAQTAGVGRLQVLTPRHHSAPPQTRWPRCRLNWRRRAGWRRVWRGWWRALRVAGVAAREKKGGSRVEGERPCALNTVLVFCREKNEKQQRDHRPAADASSS